MQRKSGSPLTLNRRNKTRRAIWAMLLVVTLICPYAALAVDVDQACDMGVTFANPAQNLCVPAIARNATLNINAVDAEWAAGTFYDHNEYVTGLPQSARVRVSRRATGINKSDLLLFFDVTGDSSDQLGDEINIGLNPGATDPTMGTLIRITGLPTPTKQRFTYTLATGWNPGPLNEPFYEVATQTFSGGWSAEVRISLDAIPANSITGTDFRLNLELIADDGVMPVKYQWFDQSLATTPTTPAVPICSNPVRWQPMSFSTGTGAGTNCPHPDLSIAGGLYSCGDVYILRGVVKSTEIAVNQVNAFHADVTKTGGPAPDVEVYLTLMNLGLGTVPLAMNYNHTDAAITNFFKSKYGTWMEATDKLDHATPSATPFLLNAASNTDKRFDWKPSDETRFDDPATTFPGHRCTSAFVNYKDDPNFDNNFSYCNTSVVTCPTGEICPMFFSIGQVFPKRRPQENAVMRMVVTALNEPFPGWFNQGRFNLEGGGLKRVNAQVFEAAVPVKGEVPLKISFAPPRGRVEPTPSPKYPAPEYPAPSPKPTRNVNSIDRAHAVAEPQKGSDPVKERNDRLKKIYGDRPIIVVQGFVPAGNKTGADGKSLQVYAPVSYVAFVVDTKAPGATPTPPVKPKRGCGKSGGQSFALFSLVAFLGIAFTWRRARRRTRAGKPAK